MKRNVQLVGVLGSMGLIIILAGCASSQPVKSAGTGVAASPETEAVFATGSWKATPAELPDLVAKAVLDDVETAAKGINTLSADFSYAVTSARQQQLITGKVLMMKPNFLRITYDYMAHPAFPNPIVCDGEKIFTFTPKSFLPNRTFSNEPFDPILGAQYASGSLPGGGSISSSPADPEGRNVHLWDGIPLQAFYDSSTALRYLYFRNINEVKSAGESDVGGIHYRVLFHHYQGGNIAGGERSDFDQYLYVGPDNLIHMYLLEFTSAANRGVQVMRLSNIQTNVPLTKADFTFTPPVAADDSK